MEVISPTPSVIGARYGYFSSPLLRVVPATGIFSLPFCDRCPIRVYSLSPSAIDAHYGYVWARFQARSERAKQTSTHRRAVRIRRRASRIAETRTRRIASRPDVADLVDHRLNHY
eukprot:6882976-Pyramimonas_sp.AAC.1